MTIRSFIAGLPANEPAVLSNLAAVGLTAAVTFGWHLSTGQIAEAAAVIFIVATAVQRANVTPNSSVPTVLAPLVKEVPALAPVIQAAPEIIAAAEAVKSVLEPAAPRTPGA